MTDPRHDDSDTPSLFLDALYDGVEDGWASLFTGEHVTHWRHATRAGELAHIANGLHDLDIWFGPATRKRNLGPNRRGGRADCAELTALWNDIDIAGPAHAEPGLPPSIEAAHQLLNRYPLPPTLIVHSGHGLQAWWLLTEPVPATIAEPLLARWGATWAAKAAELGWRIDNVFNIDRVMRLPGTTNHKLGRAEPVAILHADWQLRYDHTELDEHTIDPPTPDPARRTNPAGVPYIGPERPGDAYNARHTGSELLGGHGFTLTRRDRSGDEHWTRPGKDPREGASATVYASDGHTTIWSDTCRQQWPTIETRRPYDPFGLHAHLDHQGDWHQATRALAANGYGTVDDLSDFAPPPSSNGQTHQNQQDAPPDEPDPSTWQPVDLSAVIAAGLTRPTPTILERVDGKHLIYRAKINSLFGSSGSGKTWVALYAIAQLARQGEHCVYIDFEDDPVTFISRLRALGLPDSVITRNTTYISPVEPATRQALEIIDDVVATSQTALVVIDSTGEAMAAQGLDQNADKEVASWMRILPRRIARLGPAVILLDHVPKDPDGPKQEIGSQRKKAAVDGASYEVTQTRPFAIGQAGQIVLRVGKDRGGNYPMRSPVADIQITSDGDGDQIGISVEVPEGYSADGTLVRHTSYAAKIANYLADTGPSTTIEIKKGVGGKAEHVATALKEMVADGFLIVEIAKRGNADAKLYVLSDAYEPSEFEN